MGSSGIIENLLISFVEWGAWEASDPSKIRRFSNAFHEFFGKIQTCSYIFLYFSGGVESMGGPRIIENTQISLHFHDFFGAVESVGSSGIIENT